MCLVLQAYFLCHANGTLNQGPSDVIYDKCHALYEENDCYRPNECIVDAVNYCKSKHITCTPPMSPPPPPPPSPPPPPPPTPPSPSPPPPSPPPPPPPTPPPPSPPPPSPPPPP